jgi:hypothetical protein
VYDLFFANKHQEVLIIGGGFGCPEPNEVTKMIIEENGTIRFQASAPLLKDSKNGPTHAVYHQGEVISLDADDLPFASQGGRMERFDTFTQKRTHFDVMLPPNAFIAVLNDKILAIGGQFQDADQCTKHYVDMFELDDDNTWRHLEAKFEPCDNFAAVTYEGRLFVCGGWNGMNALSSVRSFNPATGTWKNEGNMTKARYGLSLFVFEEELYAVGGDELDEKTSIEKRNKDTKRWELVTNCGVDRYGCAAVLVGSKVYLLGGSHFENGAEHVSTFDFVDLRIKKWASKDKGNAFFDETKRQLPRKVVWSKAVLITPPADKTKVWTNINMV